MADLEVAWFDGAETVLITAGASAPEDVVQECIRYLQVQFGATIVEEWVREESVHFPLPKSLRELLPTANPASTSAGESARAPSALQEPEFREPRLVAPVHVLDRAFEGQVERPVLEQVLRAPGTP